MRQFDRSEWIQNFFFHFWGRLSQPSRSLAGLSSSQMTKLKPFLAVINLTTLRLDLLP
jgi:hypothetical protein